MPSLHNDKFDEESLSINFVYFTANNGYW